MNDKCKFANNCKFYSKAPGPCNIYSDRLALASNGKRVYLCPYYHFLERKEKQNEYNKYHSLEREKWNRKNKKVKVIISEEELFPVFIVERADSSEQPKVYGKVYEVEEKILEEWLKAIHEFYKVQNEIKKMEGKNGN